MREPDKQTLWRVFVAVEIPDAVKERVAEYARELRAVVPDVHASWDRPEKYHLTLKFLGGVEPERVNALQRAATNAASGARPFEISVGGAGVFPPRGAPRVLWLGLHDETGGLEELHRRIEDECARENFPREVRSFHAHLTLARLRAPHGTRELAETHSSSQFASEPFGVSMVSVIRSELSAGGSRYTTLSRHTLLKSS